MEVWEGGGVEVRGGMGVEKYGDMREGRGM